MEMMKSLDNLGFGDDASKAEIIGKLDEHWSEKQSLHLARYSTSFSPIPNRKRVSQTLDELVTEI